MAIKEKNTAYGIDLNAKPPFTAAIVNYECPMKFRPLTLDQYNETKNPIKHVQSFKSHLIFLGASNEMMCRSFPLTFCNTA